MTDDERRTILKKIQDEKEPFMTGIPLLYNGERQRFNVYQIPLDVLKYNPHNGRIGSEVKSFEKQHHTINPDDPRDVEIIERFLWNSKTSANQKTMDSLLDEHQQKFGIVTATGTIIDGNRRALLLNRIWKNDSISIAKKSHCQWFLAIILPVDASKKEILRLETTYQMGEDAKVDYNPIEKYLKCKDLTDAGFTENEIVKFMGDSLPNIRMYKSVLGLMDEYLETYNYEGIYTIISNEDSFQKLDSSLKKYKRGPISNMWDYSTEKDVSDLKAISFDYIRADFDQNKFRDIILAPDRNNPNKSIFSNKQIWLSFADEHFKVVDSIIEKPVSEYISENPDGDVKRQIITRDHEWRDKVGKKLRQSFEHHKDKLLNCQEAAEPNKLLTKAYEALAAVDTDQPSFIANASNFELVKRINKLAWDYKKILEQGIQ